MLFYDFEVFKYDWLVVFYDMTSQSKTVIVNDADRFKTFYDENKDKIWIGYNSRRYDQFIAKALLCGFDPKSVNDHIIADDLPGYSYSRLFYRSYFYNYDAMNSLDPSLKVFEGFMGYKMHESSVPFDIDRKLTRRELNEVIEYCTYDVEQLIEVFLRRQSDFEAHINLIKMFELPMDSISKTKVQLSAKILGAEKKSFKDEFNISFPECLRLDKYAHVLDWYKNNLNRDYKKSCTVDVAGMETTFAWGGVHGAKNKYVGEGHYINMDVASLYPNLMILFNLHSRAISDPSKFEDIVARRLKYKAEKNPLQAPLKLVINSTYGAMKDKYNPLYDPRQANNVCVYGQLLLLDLMEKLEPHCELIQCNTDGILIKLHNYDDYNLIDDICYEWEQRTGLELEFEEFVKVFQKDVNNYVIVAPDGSYKSKGSWVKKQNDLDYEMAIVNRAIINFMVHNIPVEKTIVECDDLREFQQVKKISRLYDYLSHNDKILQERAVRVFASKREKDGSLLMKHKKKTTLDKVANTPKQCFIHNSDVIGQSVPFYLDKDWYINLAKERIKAFYE